MLIRTFSDSIHSNFRGNKNTSYESHTTQSKVHVIFGRIVVGAGAGAVSIAVVASITFARFCRQRNHIAQQMFTLIMCQQI